MTVKSRQSKPKGKPAASANKTPSSIKIEPQSPLMHHNLQTSIPIQTPNEMSGLDFYTTIQEYSQNVQFLAFYECFLHFSCRVSRPLNPNLSKLNSNLLKFPILDLRYHIPVTNRLLGAQKQLLLRLLFDARVRPAQSAEYEDVVSNEYSEGTARGETTS